jgi:mannose-6-phosphate isomerase-like protein (cupin superfamily)
VYLDKFNLRKEQDKMKTIKSWSVEGVEVPPPFHRIIKVLLAPDISSVEEFSLSQAIIFPKSKTDNHIHDRRELIYVLSGRGYCVSNSNKVELEPDTVLLVEKGEPHQIFNESDESMKLLVVFVPPYTAEYLKTRPLAEKSE